MTPWTLCPVAFFTGYPCPGCGMGRSLLACLHGDFPAAFAHHPLGPVALCLSVTLVLLRFAGNRVSWFVEPWSVAVRAVHHRKTGITVLGITLAVWVARFGGAFDGPALVRSPLVSHSDEP